MKYVKILSKYILASYTDDYKEFFKLYSKVAGSIKKIKKLKGARKEKAIAGLRKAIDGMKDIQSALKLHNKKAIGEK